MTLPHIIIAILTSAIMGMSFVISKIGVLNLPPLLLTAMRFLVVFIILAPITRKPTMPIKKMVPATVMYGLYNAFSFIAIFWGIEISVSVILLQLHVPIMCFMGMYFFGDRLGWRRTFGMIIAFIGITIISGTAKVEGDISAFIMMLIAAFFWASFNIQIKIMKMDIRNIFSFICWSAAISILPFLIASYFMEGLSIETFKQINYQGITAVLYAGIMTNIAGFGLWFYLLDKNSVNNVAPYSLLLPLFGTIGAIIILNEALTKRFVAGSLLTLLGVAIIVIRTSYDKYIRISIFRRKTENE